MNITKVATLTGHNGALYTLAQGPHPYIIYSAGGEGLVVEWNLEILDSTAVIAKVPGVVYSLKLLPEKNWLLVGTDKGGLHIIDINLKREIRYLVNHTAGIFDIGYLPSKNLVITTGGDGFFSVYNANDFTLIAKPFVAEGKVRNVAINTTESLIAIASGDNKIRLYDTNTFTEQFIFEDHVLPANVSAFMPNSQFLVTGSRDAHLHIYNTHTFDLVKTIPAHNYAIYSIVFSPNGLIMATGSRDKTVKLWNTTTLDIIVRLDKQGFDGHINSVNKLLWVNYNNYLISTGDDRSILVWQVE